MFAQSVGVPSTANTRSADLLEPEPDLPGRWRGDSQRSACCRNAALFRPAIAPQGLQALLAVFREMPSRSVAQIVDWSTRIRFMRIIVSGQHPRGSGSTAPLPHVRCGCAEVRPFRTTPKASRSGANWLMARSRRGAGAATSYGSQLVHLAKNSLPKPQRPLADSCAKSGCIWRLTGELRVSDERFLSPPANRNRNHKS